MGDDEGGRSRSKLYCTGQDDEEAELKRVELESVQRERGNSYDWTRVK